MNREESNSDKLSIIVCSRNKTISADFEYNIRSSIGADFELIWIDNSDNHHSIHSAYNEGISLSTGNILVFMHEDIRFHSSDWGLEVARVLSYPEAGLVGVIGIQVVDNLSDFRIWSSHCCGNLIQGCRLPHQKDKYITQKINDGAPWPPDNVQECVFLDGLFIAGKRELFDKVKFDETLGGFHGYDFDISMQVREANKKVLVSAGILIEHFSMGVFDDRFAEGMKKLHKKWKHKLPLVVGLSGTKLEKANIELEKHTSSILPWLVSKYTSGVSALEYWLLKNMLKQSNLDLGEVRNAGWGFVKDGENPVKLRFKLLFKLLKSRFS